MAYPFETSSKKASCLLLLLFLSSTAFSAEGNLYLGGSLAASMARLGSSFPQITYVSGTEITDAYPLNSNHSSAALLGINGGYEFAGSQWKPAIALGLGVYRSLSQYDYRGQLIETAAGDPSSTLYDYKYSIDNTRLMAEMQLTWMLGKFAPFINFGIGPSWNQMGEYTETPTTDDGFTALSPFQSRTNANLAYQLGLGVSCGFNIKDSNSEFKHERVSLGYRYVNLGETSFGTRGTDYPYNLNTGRLKTNDVYLSYIHLF